MNIGYLEKKEMEDSNSYLRELAIDFLTLVLVMMRPRVQFSLAAPLLSRLPASKQFIPNSLRSPFMLEIGKKSENKISLSLFFPLLQGRVSCS
jgi:hypothetical protein